MLTALFGWQLLLIALVDADELWLPDRLTLPLLVSGLIAAATLPDRTLFNAVRGTAVGFAVLWAVGEIYRRLRAREGLGGGDPILFGAVGAWVGGIGLPSVLLALCGWFELDHRARIGAKAADARRAVAIWALHRHRRLDDLALRSDRAGMRTPSIIQPSPC